MSITITTTASSVTVTSPYDGGFVIRARELGGTWSGAQWSFDARDEQRVRQLVRDVYGDDGTDTTLVTVRVAVAGRAGREKSLHLAGRTLAERPARDSRVRLGHGVVVIEGGFPGSGGSVKNPDLSAREGTVLEVRDLPTAAARKMVEDCPYGCEVTVLREEGTGSTASDESIAAVDAAISELALVDVEMSLSYQTLTEQLDWDGLWDDQRAGMVVSAITAAIAAYHRQQIADLKSTPQEIHVSAPAESE